MEKMAGNATSTSRTETSSTSRVLSKEFDVVYLESVKSSQAATVQKDGPVAGLGISKVEAYFSYRHIKRSADDDDSLLLPFSLKGDA